MEKANCETQGTVCPEVSDQYSSTPTLQYSDGARLTHMGLPTPNLFNGGANFHSRTEWVSLQWMEKAVEVIVNLCALWSRQPPNK